MTVVCGDDIRRLVAGWLVGFGSATLGVLTPATSLDGWCSAPSAMRPPKDEALVRELFELTGDELAS